MYAVRIRPDLNGAAEFKARWGALDDNDLAILMHEIDMLKRLGPEADTALEVLDGRIEVHVIPITGTNIKLLFGLVFADAVIMMLNVCTEDNQCDAYKDACEAFGLTNPVREKIGG